MTTITSLKMRQRSPPVNKKSSAGESKRFLRCMCRYYAPFSAFLVAFQLLGVFVNMQSFLSMENIPSLDQLSVQNLFEASQQAQIYPRTIFIGGTVFPSRKNRAVDDVWSGTRALKHRYPKPVELLPGSVALDENQDTQCVLGADWQMRFYPICNSFHELGFRLKSLEASQNQQSREMTDEASMEFLGSGKSRDAWKLEKDDQAIVLKTLQVDGEFSPLTYYHQIIDAIASERLTPSPYVIDTYGFCGASVFNELGISHQVKEKFSMAEKLRYARDLAGGVADLHTIGGASNAMLLHGDLRRGNVMFSSDRSTMKLSDFNLGFLIGWNKEKNEPCGHKRDVTFRARLRDKFSAPEETFGEVLTEKTDVYHLGGMIFYLLTGGKPFIYNDSDDLDKAGNPRMDGKWLLPVLPQRLEGSDDPAVLTMWKAAQACLRYKPKNRPMAREIFTMLNKLESEKDKK